VKNLPLGSCRDLFLFDYVTVLVALLF